MYVLFCANSMSDAARTARADKVDDLIRQLRSDPDYKVRLSAALHLLRTGFDVQVYEQAPRITEIGAGIQISPNASRLLHRVFFG